MVPNDQVDADAGARQLERGHEVGTAAIAQIASAFAGRESTTVEEVLTLVEGLAKALATASSAAITQDTQQALKSSTASLTSISAPAIPIDQAVQDDKVYCLCCGRGFTMLKRHLRAEHQLSEEEYRAKFSLDDDFPLVAPAYSARKADYARSSGLGKYERAQPKNTEV